MTDDWLDLWQRSGYSPHVRDLMVAHVAMRGALKDVNERLLALDPATMTAEERARVQYWLAQAQRPIDPDFRRGIPQLFEYYKAVALLLHDEALLQRLVFAIDAFGQWLQRSAKEA
jgi:hypothetical protein